MAFCGYTPRVKNIDDRKRVQSLQAILSMDSLLVVLGCKRLVIRTCTQRLLKGRTTLMSHAPRDLNLMLGQNHSGKLLREREDRI
jgi:hypothetical protein